LNISDQTSPNITTSYKIKNLRSIKVTTDGKTAIAVQDDCNVTALNLSDPKLSKYWTIDRIHQHEKLDDVITQTLLLNDRTLLILDTEITIYDITNIIAPVELASIPILINETQTIPIIQTFTFSHETNCLYLQVYDSRYNVEPFRLQIYNLSVLSSPYLMTEHAFFKAQDMQNRDFITYASDLKTGFICANGYLYKITVPISQDEQVQILGRIPFSLMADSKNFILSSDNKTIYKVDFNQRIPLIFSMQVQHSFYIKQEKFLLGEKYSDQTGVLSRNEALDYDLINQTAYKILKLSLLNFEIASYQTEPDITESPLPSWIEFDYQNNFLTVQPQDRNDIGFYTLQSAISFKIPDNAFDPLGISSEELIVWLIALNYIDNQLFLTPNFASIQDLKAFYLPPSFNSSKQQIYDTLKTYYIKTSTVFEIASSLQLKNSDNNLTISTPNSENIKVDIELSSPQESQALFLHKSYAPLAPVTIENFPIPRLHFEGNLKDINAAIKSIVVDFAAANSTNCGANFTIQDGLNKPLTVSLTDAASLFLPNHPPELNNKTLTVQQQINAIDVFTGQQFMIDLDKDTFKDNYSEALTYQLVMANSDTEQVPKWLSLTGLKLRGNPPEETLPDIELAIIAKNEFKQIREPFKLHVKISLAYFLKLLTKYGSYVISFIGVVLSLNKIFNVIGKGYYKHPKEYILDSGENITSETIAPIFFIHKEKRERNLLLKHLEKYLSRRLQLKKIKRSTLVTYFANSDSKQLDQQKIVNTLEEIVSELSTKDRKILSNYCSTKNPRKSLIDQLIVDQLILWQLAQDKETKSIFNKVKGKWTHMVHWNSSLSKFTLNQTKFEKVLEENVPSSQKDSTLQLNDDSSTLLISERVNLDLLKGSVLAYAFETHQIDSLPAKVDVSMKEQIEHNFIWRFLKRDLKKIDKVNYGINWDITDDTLSFSGIAKSNLEGKNLVIQISTSRDWILKEIWIRGTS